MGNCTLPEEVTLREDGIVMVGVPVGTEQFVYDHWLPGSLGPVIDAALRLGLQHVLKKTEPLTDEQWAQATLATKDG
eukprot:gene18342-23426_t